MLKYENTAEIGDLIKAYDFEPVEGRPDAYLVGRVLRKGPVYVEIEPGRKAYVCDGYTVYVTDSVSGSDKLDMDRIGREMYVPYETAIWDYDGRVEELA